VAVAAGIVADVLMAATGTHLFVPTQSSRTAQADGFQRFLMESGWLLPLCKGRAETADNVRQFKTGLHLL
jgi:hypothetical protein